MASPVMAITLLQVLHHAGERPYERVDSVRESDAVQRQTSVRADLHVEVDPIVVDYLRSPFRERRVLVVNSENHPQPYDRKTPVVQAEQVSAVEEMDDALIRDEVLLDAFLSQHRLQCLGVDRLVFDQLEGVVALSELGFESDDEPDETGQ